MGETTRIGATLVGSCAKGDKAGYQGWISLKNEDEENFTLAAKARKGKGKKNPSQSGVKGKK